MYKYRAFGLNIESEIVLPEVMSVEENGMTDVTVIINPISDEASVRLDDTYNSEKKWYCLLNSNHMAFRAMDFSFEVKDGKEITVSIPGIEYQPEKLRIFLLGTAFGALNIQRGLVPIHGAAIENGSNAIIITGYFGVGKSTIEDGLVRRGMKYIADDVSVIETIEIPYVLPAYPQRKLPTDVAVQAGYDIENTLRITEDGREKCLFNDAREWCSEKRKLTKIVEIVPKEAGFGKSGGVEVKKVTGHHSLNLVLRNLYRHNFHVDVGIQPQLMKDILRITSEIQAFQIYRKHQKNTVDETVTLVKQIAENDLE